NRPYYAIMFERPIPGFQPSPEAYEFSLRPLRVLRGAVEECIATGVFRPVDPDEIVGVLWAAVHGTVSLELADYAGAQNPKARFDELTRAAAMYYMTGPPA